MRITPRIVYIGLQPENVNTNGIFVIYDESDILSCPPKSRETLNQYFKSLLKKKVPLDDKSFKDEMLKTHFLEKSNRVTIDPRNATVSY